MAIPCQGFTFTWGELPLLQVAELEIAMQRGLPVARTVIWTPNIGEVRLIGFSPLNLSLAEYGKRKRLTIVAPVPQHLQGLYGGATMTLLDSDCIYQDVNNTAASNDAIRFAYTFKVMDTLGAPSNP